MDQRNHMSEAEKYAWGATERQARLGDIAAVKAGSMTLEKAQKNARSRARKSGMTAGEAYRYFCRSRPNELAQ